MRPVCDAAQKLLKQVGAVQPVIEAYAEQSEADRQVAHEIYDALLDEGYFATLAPSAFGGLELHPTDAYLIWEAISRIDSSTGWNLQISSAVSSFTSWLPQEGLEEIFHEGPDVVFAGALANPGTAVRVDGGWRVSGRLNIASGCHRASWFSVPFIEVVDQSPQFDPLRQNPPNLVSFLPRYEVDIEDTWFTSGMRATYSCDVLIDDVFVPSPRVGTVGRQCNDERAPAMRGPLYGTMPWPGIQGETIVSIAIAHCAIDKLLELATRKYPNYSRKMLKDRSVAQHHAGKARALVDAARHYLNQSITAAYAECEENQVLSDATAQDCQLACCFGAEMAAQAVDLVHEAVGIHGTRLEAGFERHFRDVHALTQHAAKSYSRYEDVGQLMFGMHPDWFLLTL